MEKLRVVYFGTPAFSAHLLEGLLSDNSLPIEISLVVTQPDKPVGRKQILTPSAVKELAQSYNIPVETKLKTLAPQLTGFDLAILYAFGRIISEELLSIPRYGFWNLHPSLLPKYRGASPIAYPLLLGETKTGISIMQMDTDMDHGPLLYQEEYGISPEEGREELENTLTDKGLSNFKKLLINSFGQSREGGESPLFKPTSPPPTFQKHEDATFTKLLEKKDGFISIEVLRKAAQNLQLIPAEIPKILQEYFKNDLEKIKTFTASARSPQIIYNFFRGISPWPGLWTVVKIKNQEKRLKIVEMKLHGNVLEFVTVQLEGKNPIPFSTFIKAYPDIF